MAEKRERPSRTILRSRIEKQLKRQQEEQKKELLKKRIDIAKEGMRLMKAGQTIQAIKNYQQYILILEYWKKCGRDGLSIDHFDRAKDLYEIVLLSGIYWDMSKLYDRAKSIDQKQELNLCLQKYVVFSKGMPFQTLAGEALRRYLGSGRCKHRVEFKSTYGSLTGDRCFIATSLLDVTEPETIVRLREFRDDTLRRSKAGRLFTRYYYRYSPSLVKRIETLPESFRKRLGSTLDRFSKFVQSE